MDQSLDKKIEVKDKLISLYNRHKFKFYLVIFILFLAVATFLFLDENKKKNNKIISEKYVQAGLLMASGKAGEAQKLYEDIILSKNKFYSILSLNVILEKNLIEDKNQIIEYFEILENLNYSEESEELISLKKALYFLKQSDTETANDLLKKLIDKDSKFKSIAQEIISK